MNLTYNLDLDLLNMLHFMLTFDTKINLSNTLIYIN